MAGPEVAAAAAEAAVTALCHEQSCLREIFGGKEDFPSKGLWSPTLLPNAESFSDNHVQDTNTKEDSTKSEIRDTSMRQNDIPLTLQLRTAIATALGAAAAHAKSLADEEDMEIESLVATIIETQLKKLHYKIKHFDKLEVIMEKEYAELEELKESLIEELIDVLQRAIASGVTKYRDHTSVKSESGSVF